jgi:hypothetical protein
MGKSTLDDSRKKLLAQIAEEVADLPEHLQQAAFTTLLNRALDPKQPEPPPLKHHNIGQQPSTNRPSAAVSTFGEYYSTFPPDLSIDDQLLIACSFAETQSGDRTFTIDACHDLLKDIGIKLTNPTVYANRLKNKRLIITIGKAGKRAYKLRLSPNGHKALKTIQEAKE